MIDTIKILQREKQNRGFRKHPLTYLSREERYIYGFGVAIVAAGNIKTITELREVFSNFIYSLNLGEDAMDQYVVDLNNHFEKRIKQLLYFLEQDVEYKYCLYIDLKKICMHTDWGKEYAYSVFQQFRVLLHLSDCEEHFMERFIQYQLPKSMKKAEHEYQKFIQSGYHMSTIYLQHMNSGYRVENHFKQSEYTMGGSHFIDCDTVVEGDIKIANGTKVIIKNTKLMVGGSIYVEDGQLMIIESEIYDWNPLNNGVRQKQPILMIRDIHQLILKETAFYGSDCRGILLQEKGIANIQNCKFLNTANSPAILYSGEKFELRNSEFRNCANGGIRIIGEMDVKVADSMFVKCSADHGGGIYCKNRGKTEIKSSTFIDCMARYYLGAAIYFPYKRVNQKVEDIEIIGAVPEEKAVFNEDT